MPQINEKTKSTCYFPTLLKEFITFAFKLLYERIVFVSERLAGDVRCHQKFPAFPKEEYQVSWGKEEAVFIDIERAKGRAKSDPIQLGLVKYSYGARGVVCKEDIWTESY